MERPQDVVSIPKTVGEHIKYERVRRGLRQKDLALATNAGLWTVITWERHNAEPSVKFIPALIKWLGYDPFPVGETFGEKVKWKRKKVGLTRKAMAKQLRLNYSSVEQWEHDVCRPNEENKKKLEDVVGAIEEMAATHPASCG